MELANFGGFERDMDYPLAEFSATRFSIAPSRSTSTPIRYLRCVYGSAHTLRIGFYKVYFA